MPDEGRGGAGASSSNSVHNNIIAMSQSTVQKPPIFFTTNQQSDGRNRLRRIEFEFMGYSYKFALNPEEYTQPEPSKAQVVQTKGGAFVDDFGAGIPNIYFKGTTGFKNGTGDPTSGFDKFKELRDLIRLYYYKQAPGTIITPDKELIFHNYTDGEHWVVHPRTFNLMRSLARPLLYLYEVQLICLRPADQPYQKDLEDDIGYLERLVIE